MVSAYCIDGGRARSASQSSARSEFGLTDTQAEELARTCDLFATEGNVPAGASEYSDNQLEQIKRVYHKAVTDTDTQLEEVVSAYCLDGGLARSLSQAIGRS